MTPKTKSYHLVLSGWWVRGFAHVWVYKALVEAWYVISSVAGTSMWALVWALIASGKSPIEIEAICTKKSLLQYLDITFWYDGILSSSKIRSTLKKATDVKNIEQLKIPLTICVTDIAKAQPLYYTSGDLAKLVSASCAVPGIFKPIYYEDKCLVDGCITNDFPVETTPQWASLIGVHVNPLVVRKKYTLKDISTIWLSILLARDVKQQSTQCEIFIEPPQLKDIEQSIFIEPQKIINIGYEYTKQLLRKK